jgi:hypothetical protein
MRSGPVLTMVFVAGGIGLGAPGDAIAGLAPGLTALDRPHGGVVTVGYWRRYYQQYGYGPGRYAVPPVVVPGPVVVRPAVVETQVVPPPPPPPPPRPASCGEYRYWNGDYCVDALYNRTYVGPRP